MMHFSHTEYLLPEVKGVNNQVSPFVHSHNEKLF